MFGSAGLSPIHIMKTLFLILKCDVIVIKRKYMQSYRPIGDKGKIANAFFVAVKLPLKRSLTFTSTL